jgi:Domain of unknown function (DUF4440)
MPFYNRTGIRMPCRFVFLLVVMSAVAMFSTARSAVAAPCKPPESEAMLTGPVYAAIQAECNWVDAINRRDAKSASRILHPEVRQVDGNGAVRNRAALLAVVTGGRFGFISMNVRDVGVSFSAGSTNVVISTWVFGNRKHRVTDVYFCDVFHACVYRLIAEQITIIPR